MDLDTLGIDDVHEIDGSESAVHRLSCDQCRRRKVRCDRIDPCGPCSRKAVRCTYPTGFKPRAKRQRTLVSDNYESKLDDISQKLDDIATVVNTIESSLNHTEIKCPAVTHNETAQTTPLSSIPAHLTPSEFCDDTSEPESNNMLTTQVTLATDFAQQTLDNNHPLQGLPEVKDTLDELRKTLSDVTSTDARSSSLEGLRNSSRTALYGLTLTPMPFAMAAIQKLRGPPRLRFWWPLEFPNVSHFVEYVMNLYCGKPSLADLIIVHCGLHHLFIACEQLETEKALKDEFKSQRTLCYKNLEAILADLPFHMPNNYDFVLALFMASTHYIYAFQVSLSSKYLAAAVQMSLVLNYHHDIPSRTESKEVRKRRIRLFWIIYMVEKLLSLRLNRSSMIRDENITVPLQDSENDDGFPDIIPKWIKMGMLYGRVHDELFSPGALLLPAADRAARAQDLTTKLQTLFDSRDPREDKFYEESRDGLSDSSFEMVTRADRVSHLSILTLIYRALQPSFTTGSVFSEECLSTAKECLEEHKRCLSLLKGAHSTDLEFYVQWALFAAPFTPFIVIFCYAIETRDSSHLDSLASVVEILQMLPADLPNAYGKQRRVFKLMYDVAYKYLRSPESQISNTHTFGRIPDIPFEMLFTEAGIPVPNQTQTNTGTQTFQELAAEVSGMAFRNASAGEDGNNPAYGAELGMWLNQNHQIFEMLDDYP